MLRYPQIKTVLRNCEGYRDGWTTTKGIRARAESTVSPAVGEYDDAELAAAKPFDEMPKIKAFPIIGGAWIYMPLIGRYSLDKGHEADIHKHEVYGDVVREQFGRMNVVSCYRAEDLETLMRHEGKYPFRVEFSTLKAYRESRKKWYSNTGMMVLQGEEWYNLRSKVQPLLMKPKNIIAYLEPMQDVARDFLKRIVDNRDNVREVPHFLEELYKWSLESVAFVGLDTRLGCLDSNLSRDSDGLRMITAVQTIFDLMIQLELFGGNIPFWKYISTPNWRKFVQASDVFTEIAHKHINKSMEVLKENADEDKDLSLLQSMLLTKGLDVSGILVTVADMLMAGIDTTAHTVGFMLYHLARNPDKQQLLYEEVSNLLPSKEDKITATIFGRLDYLKCCLKEAIRLHPVAKGFARTLDKDVVLSGYRVPAGNTVIAVSQVIFRDERYFKNADQFIPERWLDKENKPNPFAFMPFGVGPRSCVGRRIAELEMICLVTELMRNFKVEYHHEDLDMITKLVNIPDKPLRFNFIDR